MASRTKEETYQVLEAELYSHRLLNSIEDHTSKDTMLARLKKLEVFTAEQILERHTIRYRNKDVGGEVSRADATVILEEDKLEIYMTESYFEIDKTLDELVTSLGWALGIDPIKNSLHLRMLYYVLALEDHNKIAHVLEKNGIPENLDADDDDYDWNFRESMPNDDQIGGGLGGWGESGSAGTGAGGSALLVISSTNFDRYAHLFVPDKAAGCWATAGDGSGLSSSGELPSGLGFRVIVPSAETRGTGGYWEDDEGDGDDEHLQFLGELEASLSETVIATGEGEF
jgi:hypothetical protein